MEISELFELSQCLIDIFPELEKIWVNEGLLNDAEEITFHTVWIWFGSVCFGVLSNASEKQIKKLCTIITNSVSQKGELENAVSTCFLEHASQLKVRKILIPYLSDEAKRELR